MPRYRVNHDYASGGLRLDAGDTVEVEADEAARLERDSPGVLTAIDAGRSAVGQDDRDNDGSGDAGVRTIDRPPRDRRQRAAKRRGNDGGPARDAPAEAG